MTGTHPFAAVLLAGGRSRRMGRDKALLPLPDGRWLWQRQFDVLRALEPAELFISGPAREVFPRGLVLLADDVPGLGPLAGIVAALKAVRSPRVLVLAIDLPAMTAAFLRGLLTGGSGDDAAKGIIPQMTNSFFEPLAAVYPRASLELAETQLHGADRSLQTFATTLVNNGLAFARPVADADARLFVNWNEPGDLTR